MHHTQHATSVFSWKAFFNTKGKKKKVTNFVLSLTIPWLLTGTLAFHPQFLLLF